MDTVSYLIHNSDSYPLFLMALNGFENDGKMTMSVPKGSVNPNNIQMDEIYLNVKLNLAFVKVAGVEVRVESSSHDIVFFHDEILKTIRIEFSLPKFFFANNVIELLPSTKGKHFNRFAWSMQEYCKFWLQIIRNTIKQIFHDVTHGLEAIKMTDVEIRRFDPVYNQVFPEMSDCLLMLECQKGLQLPKTALTGYTNYHTAIGYLNDRYYWKIYHKGPEFLKNGQAWLRKQLKNYVGEDFEAAGRHAAKLYKAVTGVNQGVVDVESFRRRLPPMLFNSIKKVYS